ncbi:MAG: rod shape-determining protein MreD [Rhodospirillales bacterium]|nr:rod shape-determining protein MreD [Rhodospirillales bacterium]
MKPTFGQRMDIQARRLVPAAVTLALVLLAAVPLHVPGLARIMPLLALIGVYHWTAYRPDLMTAPVVFAIGVFQDIVGGGPLGLYAAVFLLVHGGIVSQARFFVGKGFVVLWFGFALMSAAAAVIAWVVMVLFNTALMDPWTLLYQYLLTLGVFPILSRLFLRWHPALAAGN